TAAAVGAVDGGERGLPGGPGPDLTRGRPGGGAGRAVTAQDPARGRGRRTDRTGLRGGAPRPGDRRARFGGATGARRGDVLADAPLLLPGVARAEEPARRAQLGVGAGGPRQFHRRRRLPL